MKGKPNLSINGIFEILGKFNLVNFSKYKLQKDVNLVKISVSFFKFVPVYYYTFKNSLLLNLCALNKFL